MGMGGREVRGWGEGRGGDGEEGRGGGGRKGGVNVIHMTVKCTRLPPNPSQRQETVT